MSALTRLVRGVGVAELARCMAPLSAGAPVSGAAVVATTSRSYVTPSATALGWKDWIDVKLKKKSADPRKTSALPHDQFQLSNSHGPVPLAVTERVYTVDNGTRDGEIVINRNPRSDELDGTKKLRKGFGTDAQMSHFFHRLIFHTSGKHAYASVLTADGVTVTTMSTTAWALERQLYSGCDKSGCRNLGRAMAENMLQSGIVKVHWDRRGKKYHGRVKAFVDAIVAGGVSFKESAPFKA